MSPQECWWKLSLGQLTSVAAGATQATGRYSLSWGGFFSGKKKRNGGIALAVSRLGDARADAHQDDFVRRRGQGKRHIAGFSVRSLFAHLEEDQVLAHL